MHGPMPSLALMRAVKDAFDPEHRMARAGSQMRSNHRPECSTGL